MALLRDYLTEQTLRHVQDAFSAVAGQAMVICSAGGQPIFNVDWDEAYPLDEPVVVDGATIGRMRTARPTTSGGVPLRGVLQQPFLDRLLKLMANVLVEFCRGTTNRRRRLKQLAALHRMMAEFNGPHELQDILDSVTRTVSKMLKAKACAVRLLSPNGKELVIRAAHSVSPQYLDKRPMQLADSPLDQAVFDSDKPVYVEDVRSDPRVIHRDQARREGLVSALCAPLIYKKKRLGVLRVYSGRVRQFDWFERQMLQTIAGGAAAAIAGVRLYNEAVKSFKMKRQLTMAGEVQRRMIPKAPPSLPGLDISAAYVPHKELAGDFFDFIDLGNNSTGLAVCDVVGKGLRASLLMASIRASLRAHASHVNNLGSVLRRVNRDLCDGTVVGDFATMFYGVIDAKKREMSYCSAGHLPPILIRNGKAQNLQARGGVIGMSRNMDYPTDTLALEPGDVILVYTDGLSEAMNFKDEIYGQASIAEALEVAVAQNYPAESIIRHCLWDMRRFAGLRGRLDDLTLVAIKVLGSGK
jgi:sigma-B regulation protein RsbU (phosphoserine phosphatase)